ncbi:hypothetical protein DFS34DRAFT_666267, partial [Phlyctochytrium arcticum]
LTCARSFCSGSSKDRDSAEEDSLSEDESLTIEVYRTVLASRTLDPRHPVQKASFATLLANLDDIHFKDEMRMTRASFEDLVDLIKDDPVFVSRGIKPQKPVRDQLSVALSRFGQNGTGSRIGRIARLWGICEGFAYMYTLRVIKALLVHRPSFIKWPDAQNRAQIKARVYKVSAFADCIGFVDGTHIPLYEKPIKDGEDYFN